MSPQAEKYNRTVRPVVCCQRASQKRFSREYKNVILEEEENHDRTVRPVVCSERAKLVSEQSYEIYGVKTIIWENFMEVFVFGDEQVISLQRTKKSTYFQILHCVLERYTRTLNQTMHGKTDWEWLKSSRNY